MKIKDITPLIETSDVLATITFYTEVPGFTLAGSFEKDGQTVWCTLQIDDVHISLA